MRVPMFLVAAMTASAVASPGGRVIRIERARPPSVPIPVLCMMQPDLTGMCLGAAPPVGALVLVVTDTRPIAEVRLTKATVVRDGCDAMWQVTGELVRGDMAQSRGTQSVGVIDGSLDPRKTRYIDDEALAKSPDGGRGFGIDRDQDGTADILFTQSECDAGSRGAGRGDCIGVWSRGARDMHRLSTLDLRRCSR